LTGVRSVQDEDGYNQGWTGGKALAVRTDRRRDLIISRMDPAPSRTVLEIGCGRGELARSLAVKTGMQVLGVDVSEAFVTEARARTVEGNVSFEVLDFTHPAEVAGRTFDYIVGNGILHHLYDKLPASLAAMRALLVPGGRIVFLEPNLHNPYVYLIFSRPKLRVRARLEPDEMAFSRRFAVARLCEAEFDHVEVEYRDFLVPGVPDMLIRPIVRIGQIAEQTPGLKHMAQSLFISATAR
jgi:SAM-dependent methyltransferase